MTAQLGAMGRLGGWAAKNARLVFAGWAVLVVALGIFAPRVEHALAGAGWEATGSESVRVRDVVDGEFDGMSSSALMVVLHSKEHSVHGPEFRAAVARVERVLSAALGVLTNLLAVGAAFGAAKLIFQDGNLQSLLGFESQGFMDAWAPVFFFAMIFAISMDYTVFLLSSAREHRDRGESALGAMVGGVAHSGRVILAAAAVMVAVFFTFALSGPLPPKEMGVVLGLAVLLDAALVRLLLLPVLLRLLGERAWWLPRPLERLLPNVRFGHA